MSSVTTYLYVSGKTLVEYIGEETPMKKYLNLYMALENVRNQAKENDKVGPRVLIIGASDVGKTSLAKTFANYSVKCGWKPLYVNTDPDESTVVLPGTLTATTITRPTDIEEDMSLPSYVSGNSFLVYYYGYADPLEKEILYNKLCSKLAEATNKKLEDTSVKYSGCIIDTSSRVSDAVGYETLNNLVKMFNVTCIVIIGHEKLYSELKSKYVENGDLSIIKIPKSGGAIGRDKFYRRYLQMNAIRQYFYGTLKEELTAYSSGLNFNATQIYKCAEETLVPSSALPLGYEKKVTNVQIVKINSLENLTNAVLALSSIPIDSNQKVSLEEIIESSILGFVHVNEVHSETGYITVMSPCPGRFPRNYLIMGSLKWMEV